MANQSVNVPVSSWPGISCRINLSLASGEGSDITGIGFAIDYVNTVTNESRTKMMTLELVSLTGGSVYSFNGSTTFGCPFTISSLRIVTTHDDASTVEYVQNCNDLNVAPGFTVQVQMNTTVKVITGSKRQKVERFSLYSPRYYMFESFSFGEGRIMRDYTIFVYVFNCRLFHP